MASKRQLKADIKKYRRNAKKHKGLIKKMHKIGNVMRQTIDEKESKIAQLTSVLDSQHSDTAPIRMHTGKD